jgi:hypothetical protein
MLISFSCTNCGRQSQKDESLAGKKGKCKDCGHVNVIPRPSARARGAGSGVTRRKAPSGESTQPGPRQAPPPRAPSPSPAENVEDPYGLDDLPVAPKAAPPGWVDEKVSLPRGAMPVASKPKKKRSSRRGGSDFFDGLPGIIYLAMVGVLGGTYLIAVSRLLGPPYGGLTFLAAAAIAALVLFFYGFVGILVVAFRGGLLNGLLCWFCPPYLLGYAWKEWDAMRGVFISYLASLGVIMVMAVAMPRLPSVNPGLSRRESDPKPGAPGPIFPKGMPPGFPGSGFVPPAVKGPGALPPEVRPPTMTNSITVIARGLDDQSAGKALGDKLTELVKRTSDGYQFSSTSSGARSTYTISMKNTVTSQAFADQITWAKVVKVSGQTIEVDAAAQSGD